MSVLSKYSLYHKFYLIVCTLLTRLFYREARLIRFPFDIRGRRFVQIGKNFTTGVGCRLEACPTNSNSGKTLEIGNNVQINDNVHITAMSSVSIGDNVLLASKIYISDCTHGIYEGGNQDSSPLTPPQDRVFSTKRVLLHDNVWVGEFVSILPGVEIGKGSIIGANSVVTKSIPAYSIAVGTPARVIKKYNFKTKIWEKI